MKKDSTKMNVLIAMLAAVVCVFLTKTTTGALSSYEWLILYLLIHNGLWYILKE
jgi:hypothetical protein